MSPSKSTRLSSSSVTLGSYASILLLMLCLLPFLPGLKGPFQLDDISNLSRMHPGESSFDAIYEALFNNASGWFRRPLSNASLLLQAYWGAQTPLPYKFLNLALHGFNGWLVWRLATRLLGLFKGVQSSESRGIALLAAAIWTIHPLQVSSVLYVVQRMTLLSTTFTLLSVLLALRTLEVPDALPRPVDGLKKTLLVGLVALAALLCKENGALVPVLLLAILLSLPADAYSLVTDSAGKRTFMRSAIWLPCFVGAVLIAVTWHQLTAGYAGRAFDLSDRLITETRVLGDYALSFMLPLPSRMGLYVDDVSVWSTARAGWYVGPVLIVAVLAGAVVVRRRYPMLAFAVFWFFACHLMESSFIPLELKYEHRNYLALLGPALALASAVFTVSQSGSPRTFPVLALALASLFAGMTFLRSSDWSSEERFIVTELRHHPDSVRANMEAARLESVHGNNAAAAARIHALQMQHPDAYAPLAGSLELACAGYPADWARLLDYIRTHPDDAAIQNQPLYMTLIGYEQRGICPADFNSAFLRHVDDAIDIYSANGRTSGLQFFLMVKAQLQPTPQLKRALLQRAVAADPGEIGPLIQLSYLDLSIGDSAGAQAALKRLRELVPAWHPDRVHIRRLEESMKPRGN